MASVKVKFRPSTVDGKAGSVYYQVIHKGQVRQISTDYSLLPGEWDEKSGCVVFPVENKRRDDEVRTVVERMRWDQNRLRHIIRTLEDEQGNFTSEDVVTEFQQQRMRASLFGFMRHMADELRDMGRFRTAEAYKATLNSFMRFRAGKDLPVDALSAEMVKRYEACLKKKMLSLNTISFYMRILRAAYNRGTADGKARHDHPFKDVYTSIEKTRKRAIPVRMVKAIQQYASRLRMRFQQIYELRLSKEDLEDYNRHTRSKKSRGVFDVRNFDWSEFYANLEFEPWREMLLRKHRQEQRTAWKQITRYIDQGIPVPWGVYLGVVKEQHRKQNSGGHLRMIIGYNANKRVIYYSDSWGRGHEKKEMDWDTAWAITTHIFVLTPMN